ncbi:MAG: hypothetical protein WAQ98_02990 [Blastocatellia bacterium]
MGLQQLIPELKALSYKEKLEAIEFLRKDLITPEESIVMEEAALKVMELLEKYPEQVGGCTTVRGDVDIMEYSKEYAQAKI